MAHVIFGNEIYYNYATKNLLVIEFQFKDRVMEDSNPRPLVLDSWHYLSKFLLHNP